MSASNKKAPAFRFGSETPGLVDSGRKKQTNLIRVSGGGVIVRRWRSRYLLAIPIKLDAGPCSPLRVA
jgi:hypothetical protein